MSGTTAVSALQGRADEDFDTDKVRCVLDGYCRLYDTLKKQAIKLANDPSLHNANVLSLCNPDISRDHSDIVRALSYDFSKAETTWLVTHPEVKSRRDHVWRWLSLAESALERHYSAQLDGDSVREFINFESYNGLIDAELKQLGFPQKQVALRDFESIAFIGAGPLPLSAVMIHLKTGLPVTCIDCDKDAATLGKAFIDKCGLSKGIAYRHKRGDQIDYCIHPIIFIAGLVQDKESVVCQIGMSRGGNTIAVRGAVGVGSLLDKPLSSQMTQLLYIYFDRHTPAMPPFFNTTWFSSWPYWRLRVDSTVSQIIRPPTRDNEATLYRPKTGRQHSFSYNL
jgi:hypothetical protein